MQMPQSMLNFLHKCGKSSVIFIIRQQRFFGEQSQPALSDQRLIFLFINGTGG